MHRYNFTQTILSSESDGYEISIKFDSKIIYEEIPLYEMIMDIIYSLMYFLFSKYKVTGRDNWFKYLVNISIPGSYIVHFIGSKHIHMLYYEDDEPFASYPIYINPNQIRGSSYRLEILFRLSYNEGIEKTISLKRQFQF